jgi:hypothetical protein
MKTNGLRTTVWEQELDELPILDGGLVGTITRDGELATLINRLVSNPAEAADRGNANRRVLQKYPRISPELALVIAAKSLDKDLLPSPVEREAPATFNRNRL